MTDATVAIGRLPLGVAILSILVGLLGFILVLGAILLLVFASAGAVAGLAVFGPGLLGGVLLFAAGVVLLAVAGGLWDQELWALALSVIVVGVLWAALVLGGQLFTLGGIALGLLLVYLVAVHRHFD